MYYISEESDPYYKVVDESRQYAPGWVGAPLVSMEYVLALCITLKDAEEVLDALNNAA